MKSLFILICFLCISPLFSRVYDKTPLVPKPQYLKITSTQKWTMPQTVVVYADKEVSSEIQFVTEAFQKTGKKVRIIVSPTAKNACIRLLKRNKSVPAHYEGYRLDMNNNGVTIASTHKAGIFYGIQTLRNILMNCEDNQMPYLTITDYPGIGKRWGNIHMPDLKPKHIPELKRFIDLFASLKYNGLIVNLFEGFPYTDIKFPPADRISQAELADIVAYCKARHLDLIPGLQMLSHVRWLSKHPKYLEYLENPKEAKNWGVNWCPSHPEVRELWQKAVDDHIRIMKPTYFFLFMDEILQGSLGICPRCKNTHPNDLVLQEFNRYYAFLKARKVIPIICHDAFRDPKKTSVFDPHIPVMQGYKIREKFPRNTIIQYWGYGNKFDEVCVKDFNDMGFRILGGSWCVNFGNLPAMGQFMQKLGPKKMIGAVNFSWYYYSVAPEGGLYRYGYRTWPGIVLGGHCFWNPKAENIELTTLNFDPVYEARRRLFGPFNSSNLKWTSVPITSSLNSELAQEWCFPTFTPASAKEVVKDYKSLPEKFDLNINNETGALRAVVLSGNAKGTDKLPTGTVTIPLGNMKASDLTFLLSLLPTARFDYDSNEWHSYGGFMKARFGTLRVKWADGVLHDIAVHNLLHITRWNAQASSLGCRFGAVHKDKNGRLVHLSILSWKNTRPNVPLQSITLMTRYFFNRAIALYAMSAANAQNVPPKGAIKANLAKGPTRQKPSDGRIQSIKDSEIAAGSFSSMFTVGPVERKIITSPWDKNRKAVYFKARGRAPFGRVMFDFPITVPKFARGFGFRCRLSKPEAINDGAFYLLDNDLKKYTGARVKALPVPFQKEQTINAEHQTMARENAYLNPQNAKYMRLSFRMKPTTEPIEIICEIPQWYEFPPIDIFWTKEVGSMNLNP